MADVKLFIGGTPNPLYPNCDGSFEFREPHARRIAYEYANGYFTLGWPLNPSEKTYQRRALQSGQPVVGDHILMYPVPEEHILHSVAVKVHEADPQMAGATVKPSALLYDAAAGTYTELDILDNAFTNITMTQEMTAWSPVKVSQDIVVPAQTIPGAGTGGADLVIPEQTVTSTVDAPYFVEPGTTLVLTFKIISVPSDATVTIAQTSVNMALIAKVEGLDIPSEV